MLVRSVFCGWQAIGPEIYKAVGQHADAVADCRVFVRWIMLGVWPLCLYFVLQQFCACVSVLRAVPSRQGFTA